MSIIAAYAVPHPPLILPVVGRGQERAITSTIDAYDRVARRIATAQPDTVVIASPHAPAYRDGFFISDTATEAGSMASFGQPREFLDINIDLPFANALAAKLETKSIPTSGAPRSQEGIDHGTYVPLYFMEKFMDLRNTRFVRIGLSGLPAADHAFVGQAIADTARCMNRRCVFVASGDWSHKLKEDGPYGFAPEGPAFDRALAGILRSGELDRLFTMDPDLCEGASQCGLSSFQIMAGTLAGATFESELLSYEGPFGVGYGIAAFDVIENASSTEQEVEDEQDRLGIVDPLVALARSTVESYVRNLTVPAVPSNLPERYLTRRAGVFVSLHEHDRLRGCMGTIAPAHSSIADEVIGNAVAACTLDPRFNRVRPHELDYLSYSVDVLGEPEPVESLVQLNPKIYGIVVRSGSRRGLLLPDLEGVNTVADQIAIAKQKAGIGLEEDVIIERFEVIRHSLGGEARRD